MSAALLEVTDGHQAPPKRLLLGAGVMYNGSHGFHGLWRHPKAARQRQFEGLEQWVELGQLLERGRFDLLSGVFADDSFEEFVEHVVPVLRDRGLVQREYAPGTLREKLFGHRPHLPDRHRATQIRVTSKFKPAPVAAAGVAGAIGGWVAVFARTDDERIAVVIVPVDRDGLTLEDDWDGIGQRLSGTGTTRLDDVAVAAHEVILLGATRRRSPPTIRPCTRRGRSVTWRSTGPPCRPTGSSES